MKIEKIEVFAIELPLKQPFIISYARYDSMPSIIVKVTLDNGVIGYGEGIADEHVTGESMYGAYAIIEKTLAPRLIGENPLNMERIHKIMDAEILGAPTAKAALDIACYDAAGKALGVPVYHLLGGRYHDRFKLAHVLSILTPEEMAKEAKEQIDAGFSAIKIKVGTDAQLDVERILAVREAVGPTINLRVDVNQGWKNSATAIQALAQLEDAQLDWIEQPIIASDLDGMAEIKQKTTIPVMVDEGLVGIPEMRTIIQKQAGHKINIKLMKCGGIYKANQLAIIAAMENIEAQVGSMVESSVGSAAGYHVAFSKSNITSIELTGPLKFSKDVGNLAYDVPYISLNEQAGLGIDVDEQVLQELTLQSAVIQ